MLWRVVSSRSEGKSEDGDGGSSGGGEGAGSGWLTTGLATISSGVSWGIILNNWHGEVNLVGRGSSVELTLALLGNPGSASNGGGTTVLEGNLASLKWSLSTKSEALPVLVGARPVVVNEASTERGPDVDSLCRLSVKEIGNRRSVVPAVGEAKARRVPLLDSDTDFIIASSVSSDDDRLGSDDLAGDLTR